MPQRQSVQKEMIARFTERATSHVSEQVERMADAEQAPHRARRFMKMVATRKQLMLEKVLLNEPVK